MSKIDLRRGDPFYLLRPPKDDRYANLYGRKLTVGIPWANGDVTPVEEFVNIRADQVCLFNPAREPLSREP